MSSRDSVMDAHARKRHSKSRRRLEVHLHTKPRDYVPGSGPALQPISVQLAQDSTALILDRIFLPSPGLANDGRLLPKRMTYLVGFHDLPAARLLVPAMKILEYVSPYELEEWEYNREERLEKARARLQERKATEPVPVTGKRKRGRPPLQTAIEAGTVELPEGTAPENTRPQKGVLSLTTPQKPKPDVFEEPPETEFESEASPSRQLEIELASHGGLTHLDAVSMIQASQDVEDTRVTGLHHGSLGSNAASRLSGANGGRGDQRPFRLSLRPEPPHPSSSSQKSLASSLPVASIPFTRGMPSKTSSPVSKSNFFSLRPAPPNYSSPQAIPNALPPTVPWSTQQDRSQSTPAPAKQRTLLNFGFGSLSNAQPAEKELSHSQEPSTSTQTADEGEWEVKNLEGMDVYDVEGAGRVRYFLVRWEGDWPEDQNPSWEPEENVSKIQVRNYLKNRKKWDEVGKKLRASSARNGTGKMLAMATSYDDLMITTQANTLESGREHAAMASASAKSGSSAGGRQDQGSGQPAKEMWDQPRAQHFENFTR